MTWLWIALFALGCTALMGGYVYLVEIRDSATPDTSSDGSDATEPHVEGKLLNK